MTHQADHPDHPEEPDQSGQSGHPGHPEYPEYPDHPDLSLSYTPHLKATKSGKVKKLQIFGNTWLPIIENQNTDGN